MDKKYRLLLKILPDAFSYHQLLTDSRGVPVDYIFVNVNPAFENMTGLKKEQILGKKITTVYPGIVHSAFDWIGTYGRVAAGGGEIRFESYFEPSGRWYEIAAYSDTPGYFAVVSRDITANKHYQKALQESEENLSITLHSIGDGVVATDLQGRVTRMNRQAEKLTGWTFSEAAGRPLHEIFQIINAKTGEPAFNPVEHVLKTGETVKLANDTVLISRRGNWLQIADSAAPIRDSEGKISGVVMVFSDITEQYRARKKLEETTQRLEYILKATRAGIDVVDKDFNLHYVDNFWQNIYGTPQGHKCYTYFKSRRVPCENCGVPRALATKQVTLFEQNLPREGNRVVECHAVPFQNEQGAWLVAGLKIDITARRQAEKEIARYTAELERLYLKLNEEMNRAMEVHKRTLPKKLPVIKGLSFAAHYQPAERLGGDFYDLVPLDKKLVIYLSDVTGHGIDSALLSEFVKHTLKDYFILSPAENIRPEKILRYLSTRFCHENLPAEYLICIFLAVLDLDSMELSYTAAGFQDTPLVRLGNGKRAKLTSKGLFLSPAFSGKLLNLQEESIRLTPGTTIFFNTDGLTEQYAKGAYYGTRFPRIFYENSSLPPPLIAQIIREDFQEFNGGSLQGNDDITFLILQVDPNPRKTARLELASDFAELNHLQKKVSAILHGYQNADLFLACLHELTANAIEHGNRLEQNKTVSVELIITERFLQGSVKDQGAGFRWREQISKPLDLEKMSERGRGIAMARLCSERLYYNEQGNRVTFVIKCLKEENKNAN